jgi:serine/threonine protein kinase
LKAHHQIDPELNDILAHEILLGASSALKVDDDSQNRLIAARSIERELEIIKTFNHPWIIQLRENSPSEIECPENGSLADHLPSAEGPELCQLHGPTRIARIVAGIVRAMRYVHRRGIIHSNLNPGKVLLDWNWNVQIGGFDNSISINETSISNHSGQQTWPPPPFHYHAPERYCRRTVPESDVFSFGLILYELIVGTPAFPKNLEDLAIARRVSVENERPDIPDSVSPDVRKLITDCWAIDVDDRPTFDEILVPLEAMRFKLMDDVNSSKVSAFVEMIKNLEA